MLIYQPFRFTFDWLTNLYIGCSLHESKTEPVKFWKKLVLIKILAICIKETKEWLIVLA